MKNLTIKLDEDECPTLTEADFKKMRRYPVQKTITSGLEKKILFENKVKPNSRLHINVLAS